LARYNISCPADGSVTTSLRKTCASTSGQLRSTWIWCHRNGRLNTTNSPQKMKLAAAITRRVPRFSLFTPVSSRRPLEVLHLLAHFAIAADQVGHVSQLEHPNNDVGGL